MNSDSCAVPLERRSCYAAAPMPIPLRSALATMLADWQDDVPPAWRSVLADTTLDPAIVSPTLTLADGEAIWPARRAAPLPGAPSGAYPFRALEGTAPEAVRVVVIGQDPYTKVSQATGRAFEQGDVAEWTGRPSPAPSLKRILQCVAEVRTGDRAYRAAQGGWGRVLADLRAETLDLEPPRALWDRWAADGVLFLNAALTFSRFKSDVRLRGHRPLWRPVVTTILAHLARRPTGALVVVAWGGDAQQVVAASGLEAAATAAGTWRRRVDVVSAPHPNAMTPPFLGRTNRLRDIDATLARLGGSAVRW